MLLEVPLTPPKRMCLANRKDKPADPLQPAPTQVRTELVCPRKDTPFCWPCLLFQEDPLNIKVESWPYRVTYTVTRLEAIAFRLKAIALGVEAIALRLLGPLLVELHLILQSCPKVQERL